jgi:hypothetical protein
MNLQLLKNELEARLEGATCIPVRHTALSRCTDEILGMVSAYHQDGVMFLRKEDFPNALASFAYAFGWFDAGSCLGLISARSCGLPLTGPETGRRDTRDSRFIEKTGRYRRLLEAACSELVPAPEEGSCLYDTCERILMIARIFLDQGSCHERSGDLPSALAAYSYGFGWLDAGVRTGLFRINSQRELFTI